MTEWKKSTDDRSSAVIGAESSSSGGSQPPLIMVVDDDDTIRLSIRFSLENYGYRVLEVENGTEALACVERIQPDLILLDVVMKDLDGFSTCDAMRQKNAGANIPIIMVTSLEDETTILKAFECGATDFVVKPINLTVLGFRVRYWLRSSLAYLDLQKSEKRLAKAQNIARLAHWEWNLQTGMLHVNGLTPEKYGLAREIHYSRMIENIDIKDREHIAQILQKGIEEKSPFSVQYTIQGQGEERIILNQGEFVSEQSESEWKAIGIVQDITAMRLAEKKIRYLAYYDSLTGLANRSLFKEHWNRIHALNKREPIGMGVLFIDLDHFKQINDTLGHATGDKVLIQVAERLKAIFRESDILSRFQNNTITPLISRVGGDEFILLAANIEKPDHAAHLAQRILDTLSHPITVDDQQLNLSASIGISMYPNDGENIETLLKHADTAMYEAKNGGRNKYTFFHHAMNEVIKARFNLQNRLRNALSENQFSLYYQPKYSNKTGTIKGVEALIRWIDPQKGIIAPDNFLPFAEENNFIYKINSWVLKEACFQAKRWVDANLFHDCKMSVNISGKDIDFIKLKEMIESTLNVTSLDPNYLEIELTERVMMQRTDEAKEMLSNLKTMGISIAIDDFGTGYSALSHLQVFPLTTLKIDKSFIDNIEESENSRTLLLSIINIGKSLNLNVVAEGVETEIQKNALGKMECDELQGYLLSVPVTAQDAEKILSQHF